MHKARITVSVRPEVLEAAEEQVAAGRASSISAWVDQAMAEKAQRDDLLGLIAEMQAEAPPSKEDEQWARNALGL
jgi:hypothetical protein